jgi:hypothetical protein
MPKPRRLLNLGFDLQFAELDERDGVLAVDSAFLAELAATALRAHVRGPEEDKRLGSTQPLLMPEAA